MRLQFSGERVLAVVAHPDDADLLFAGTLLRAHEDNAITGICYLCMGDRGQPTIPVPDLAAARKSEAEDSAKQLHAELFPGIFSDGTLSDNEAGRLFLLRVVRTFKPTLLLTHAPNDYHADHRAAAQLAESVSWFAASGGYATEGLAALSQQPALWWGDCLGMTGFDPAIYVDISKYEQAKLHLLTGHKTQLARTADKMHHPLHDLMVRQMTTRGFECGVGAAECYRPYLTMKRSRAW